MPADPQLEAQVQNVLLNTASHLAKGNVPSGFYPHKYVRRGPEKKHMGLNTLTTVEYIGGIFKMIKDPAVPANIKPYLYSHMEELVEDAADYDWQTAVRPWSEEIFTLIAEGRLAEGWADHSPPNSLRTINLTTIFKLAPGNQVQILPSLTNLSGADLPVLTLIALKAATYSRATLPTVRSSSTFVPFVCGIQPHLTHMPSVTVGTSNDSIIRAIFSKWPGSAWP